MGKAVSAQHGFFYCKKNLHIYYSIDPFNYQQFSHKKTVDFSYNSWYNNFFDFSGILWYNIRKNKYWMTI